MPHTAAASPAASLGLLALIQPQRLFDRGLIAIAQPCHATVKSIGQQICCLRVRSLGVPRLLNCMLESRRRLPVLSRILLGDRQILRGHKFIGMSGHLRQHPLHLWHVSQEEIGDQMLRRDIGAAVHPQLVLARQLPLHVVHPPQGNKRDEQILRRDRILGLQLHRFLRIGQRLSHTDQASGRPR